MTYDLCSLGLPVVRPSASKSAIETRSASVLDFVVNSTGFAIELVIEFELDFDL